MKNLVITAALILGFGCPAWAGELDGASQDALAKTQQLLKDRDARGKAAGENETARAADKYTKSLGTDTDGVYDLSSDVFSDLVKKANGDPKLMQKMIEDAQRDPAAFANSLSPEQRSKILELAAPMANPNGNHP